MEYLDRFLAGQDAILTMCHQIKAEASPLNKVQTDLKILFILLAQYFKRQDEKFLEELEERFKGDPKTLKMIEFWQIDLKDVKVQTFSFFDRYTFEGIVPKNRRYIKDFSDLCTLIEARFEIEKNYLFPILKKG